ncbi:MAG: hypothetical protein QM483_04320 [Desulfuromusa sp.]
MTVELFQAVLGWSALINMAILIWWFLFLSFAHDWTYEMHSRFYMISRESFNNIHYVGMMIFKLFIFMFFIVPYIALRIIG